MDDEIPIRDLVRGNGNRFVQKPEQRHRCDPNFCATQNLRTVIRCHIDVIIAMEAAPRELLYIRMETAMISVDAGVDPGGPAFLIALLHAGSDLPLNFHPAAT